MLKTPGGLYVPDELQQTVEAANAKGKPPLVISDKALQALFDILSHLDWRDIVFLLKTWTTLPDEEIKAVIVHSDRFYRTLWEHGMRPRAVQSEKVKEWVRPQVGTFYETGG